VGCVGRITSYAETADGRYLITLTGVCRFLLRDELPSASPYRRFRATSTPS
jgi:Lon protease-like protein